MPHHSTRERRGNLPPSFEDTSVVKTKTEHRDGEVKIHVCNLPISTSSSHLAGLFEPFGEVLEAFVFKIPSKNGFQKGSKIGTRSAIVRMASAAAAREAILNIDGVSWKGQLLRVRVSVHNRTAIGYRNRNGNANAKTLSQTQDSDEDPPAPVTPQSEGPHAFETPRKPEPTGRKIWRRSEPAPVSPLTPPPFYHTFDVHELTSRQSSGCSTQWMGSARQSFDCSSSDSFTFECNEPIPNSSTQAKPPLSYVHDPYTQCVWGSGDEGNNTD